ncbi:S-layer family protein [Paenibacillus cellulosilyticus]|uniref:S-layer family protein n=1 Tax=Paenibacillus cellulosilyticus TaxID=375489 RepID=A0A2V2YZZ1_9BACL|nr:S-layer homology domain-containing protein [Paenibacillus cellulosilyticus]PWW08374.1 S-layer family protein [Paenibacillus cellulosilyticus]QKS47969.1 S-layer homology domain-containing protein [Paenibacillus cellulosilyticus]
MTKKIGIWFMVLAIVIGMLPSAGKTATAATSGSFSFPTEFDTPGQARITTNGLVTLTGTLNGVNSSSVVYSVYQLVGYDVNNPGVDEQIGSSREGLTSNVYINGTTIQVYNIQLFSGMNKITFTGTQGGGQVSNSIYIDYHDGPTLYDLKASLYGNDFALNEGSTAVVYSSSTKNKTTADITISGKAPNATSVTVDSNGSSRTFSVNSTSSYSFVASPVAVTLGKNLITITVSNGSQTLKTTREVAFYNGSVTFYDVNISDDTGSSSALEYSPSFVTDMSGLQIKGKVIVPNNYVQRTGESAANPHPDPTQILSNIKGTLASGSTVYKNFTSADFNASISGNYSVTDPFFVYEYTLTLPTTLPLGQTFSLTMQTINEETGTYQGTDGLYFTLVDSNKPYIDQINLLQGYQSGVSTTNMTGVTLDGQNLYGMPIGVEVLIGNANKMQDGLTISQIKSAVSSKVATTGYTVAEVESATVTRTVNGVSKSFLRLVLEFTKLPFEGKQTLTFTIDAGRSTTTESSMDATITMLYGPYVSYESLYDGLIVYDDTTADRQARADALVSTVLKQFLGRIQNVNDTDEIQYDAYIDSVTPANSKAQSIFFYVNNVLFKLDPVTDSTGTIDKTRFQLAPIDDGTGDVTNLNVFNVMFSGENAVRFVFQGTNTFYEKTVKFNIIPTNLPVIPVEGSLGIFPFSYTTDTNASIVPVQSDPKFPKNGSIYTTNSSKMNIFGTFDFIDLGKNISSITSKLTTSGSSSTTTASGIQLNDYILRITSTALSDPIEWNLSMPFAIYNSTTETYVGTYPSTVDIENVDSNGLFVRYDIETQTFAFILKDQQLNSDGTSSVYNFAAYNSGLYGSKATARLEVDPTALPYSIVRPIKTPERDIVNQNFIEVLIDAPGAETVTINKQVAEKIGKYDADYNGDYEYSDVFRVIVSDLKVGKNDIKFTIANANEKTDGKITITYAPTNIPGAQYAKVMSSSQKVFDGALALTFPKGTTLIRNDYNVAEKYKSQVFTNHNILYAIANPEDGVIDRHDFESEPSGFDQLVTSYGELFKYSFPTRFSKVSSVFWLDAGLADDITTSDYDPITRGVDPYQFPGNQNGPNGTEISSYYDRDTSQELVASKTGSLTLAFDANMKEVAGTVITVYRFDNENKYWENLGGVVDMSKNTITIPFTKFGYYVVGKMVYSFSDVTSHPYARNYMEALFAKGIINSVGSDDFGADMYTTRGEFARMMVKSLNIPLNYSLGNPSFDDVPQIVNQDAIWDYRYIETAAREGIIRGTQPRTFEPSGNLTRGDAAVILARALELKLETDSTKIDKQLQKLFKDYSSIDYYAKASVLAIAKKGYITGSPVDSSDLTKGYVFEPKANLLRSDAAIIVGKMLVDTKKLPKLN